MDVDERIAAIDKLLTEKIHAYMARNLPGVEFEFRVFESDNFFGEDEEAWDDQAPLGARLEVPAYAIEDVCGECDALADTVEGQAAYLYLLVVCELRDELRRGARPGYQDDEPFTDPLHEWVEHMRAYWLQTSRGGESTA